MSGYTSTRTFGAPRELVWGCLTEAGHVGVWFGGHDGRMEDMVCEPVVGGRWGGTMVLPDGHRIEWDGRFLVVEGPARLVWAFTDVPPLPADATEGYAITLTEVDGGTELVLTQEGGALTEEQYVEARAGTSIFLDVLAEHLATLRA
ncbi:MAG: SRPBCC domain-containing protein [Mycobacteriales bacterium]|nr:SRPBCC domain-containing protein [Mycobacteriales bacterium]